MAVLRDNCLTGTALEIPHDDAPTACVFEAENS
jgi:hypothetical protein